MIVFESPIREFKTIKAAKKFAAIVIGETKIVKSNKSAFDVYHPVGKPIYQVYVI